MEKISEHNNFVYLTVALVLLLFIAALIDQFPNHIGQRLVQASTVITLLVGILGFRSSRISFRTGIGFVISVLSVFILGIFLDISGLDYLHILLLIAFFIWATWIAARQVLFIGPIDGNKIVGAICIYLMMGLIWALSYLLIAEIIPDAFNGLEHASWEKNFADATYYSFVTLTTLGYGDITPKASIARFLVYMEAIVGVFYMAILVASLVGIRISTTLLEKE